MKFLIFCILIILGSCCFGCITNNVNVYPATIPPTPSSTIPVSSQIISLKPTEVLPSYTQSNNEQTTQNNVLAKQSISDAQMYIDKTDDFITDFLINRNMSRNDLRLLNINNLRDNAADLVSKANDAVTLNNFGDAQKYANQAIDLAKEAIGLASQLQGTR